MTAYTNWSAELVADLATGQVTVTSTVPAASVGVTASRDESDSTTNAAATPPNDTPVALRKLLPEIVTTSLPAVVPVVTSSPDTTGGGANENRSAVVMADVPSEDWTLTSTW